MIRCGSDPDTLGIRFDTPGVTTRRVGPTTVRRDRHTWCTPSRGYHRLHPGVSPMTPTIRDKPWSRPTSWENPSMCKRSPRAARRLVSPSRPRRALSRMSVPDACHLRRHRGPSRPPPIPPTVRAVARPSPSWAQSCATGPGRRLGSPTFGRAGKCGQGCRRCGFGVTRRESRDRPCTPAGGSCHALRARWPTAVRARWDCRVVARSRVARSPRTSCPERPAVRGR